MYIIALARETNALSLKTRWKLELHKSLQHLAAPEVSSRQDAPEAAPEVDATQYESCLGLGTTAYECETGRTTAYECETERTSANVRNY